MFGWFRPTCRVDPPTKEWIEQHMAWLTGEFGAERLLDTEVILPTPEYFPDPYDGSKRQARILLKRVCRYMRVEPERIQIKFSMEKRPCPGLEGAYSGFAGLYEGDTIWIQECQLSDPMALVGVMAHELGHVHLLGDSRITPDAEDHEPLTDLLTVFLGLGIFTGNSVIQETRIEGGYNMARLGYLTMDMYGYAFALFAWFRGEERPAWQKHLRGDVYASFKKGLRYVTATGDSLFKPLRMRHAGGAK